MPPRAKNQEEVDARFWAKVEKTDTCWLWRGAINRIGYGSVAGVRPDRRSQTVYAHRVSYAMTHGPIPPGMCVCHRCDVRACVNPDHLFLGTRGDNNADVQAKNRNHKAGTKVAKLTPEQVVEIRRRYALGDTSCPKLAREFGVQQMAVNRVVNRLSWTWVKD